jgi:PilZ domain
MGLKPTRRVGGARHNVSLRVAFFRGEREIQAWALNLSRGGLRAIVEDEHLDAGTLIDVRLGDDPMSRPMRIVWTSPEPDGTIVGAEFLDPLPEGIVPERGSQPSFPAVKIPIAMGPQAAPNPGPSGPALIVPEANVSPSSIPPPGDGE